MINKIKGWFSKQSKITPPKKTSLLFDLYGERQEYEYLKAKIAEIENVINNLPPPTPLPDLSNYAVKNANNNFTANQSISGNTAYLEFKQGAVRKGYIGKSSERADDVEVRAETNSLKLGAKHNIILETGTGYNTLLDKQPTANNHVVNKQYVDTKIRQEIDAIPPSSGVDTTNLAKLNETNIFTGLNSFNGNVLFGDVVGIGNVIAYGNADYEPVEDGELISKYYLNQQLNNIFSQPFKRYWFAKPSRNLRVRQRILSNGIYAYKLLSSFSESIYLGDEYGGENAICKSTMLSVGNVYFGVVNEFKTYQVDGNGYIRPSTYTNSNWIISDVKLLPSDNDENEVLAQCLFEVYL